MNEKAMVSDTLAGINSELVRMSEMISQTENPQLKNMLKQMRNQCEASQEEIYQIARARQYYVPAAQAAPDEIQHVRQLFSPYPCLDLPVFIPGRHPHQYFKWHGTDAFYIFSARFFSGYPAFVCMVCHSPLWHSGLSLGASCK